MPLLSKSWISYLAIKVRGLKNKEERVCYQNPFNNFTQPICYAHESTCRFHIFEIEIVLLHQDHTKYSSNSPYLDHFRQPQAIFWDIILARFARRTVRLRVLSLERQIVRHFGVSLKHGRRLDQYHSYFWLVKYSRQFFRQHMITFITKQWCDSRVKC